MAAEIAKIAPANPPQQIEIDDYARLFTGDVDFEIFLSRQET